MLTDDQKHIIIELLKQRTNPSDLEKDILDTLKETDKRVLDSLQAQARIVNNYGKYPDLYAKINFLPATVQKPAGQIQEIDLRYILNMQFEFLLEKEWEEKFRG